MFIEPDEHLIVLEDDYYNPFSPSDWDALHVAGVRTVLVPHVVSRNHIDPTWDTRFKILLPFFYSGENFVDLVARQDEIVRWAYTCIRLYPQVQFIFGIPDGGEFLWKDANQTKDFPLSDHQIADFVITIQRVLVEQYGEIWSCLHNFLGDPKNWNNVHLPYLYRALRDEFPTVPFYSVQYAHFYCGAAPNDPRKQTLVTKYTEQYGIRFWVGSQYCEGLLHNFDVAMEQKAWGFITAPRHSENPIKHDRIKNWMIQILRDADKRLKGHFDGTN